VLRQGTSGAPQAVAPVDGAASLSDTSPRASTKPFPYRIACDLLLDGQVIPFLGAGVGLSARPQDNKSAASNRPFLPSNRELKEIIAKACDFPVAEFESSDIAEVASYLVERTDRTHLDELLERTLGRADYTPSETHRVLADMARRTPLLILSTNYDTLMEQALQEKEVPFDVLAYVSGYGEARDRLAWIERGASKAEFVRPSKVGRNSDRSLVFRLHGAAAVGGKRIGPYVITEEDQIDWILRLRGRESWLPPFVSAALAKGHLLSLGHSARDWSQRALLRTLSDQNRQRAAWAVALRPSSLSIMTWQRYDVDVFNEDLNHWASRLKGIGAA
jgi:hypothetical protein